MKGMRGRRRAGMTGEKRLALNLLILAALAALCVLAAQYPVLRL